MSCIALYFSAFFSSHSIKILFSLPLLLNTLDKANRIFLSFNSSKKDSKSFSSSSPQPPCSLYVAQVIKYGGSTYTKSFDVNFDVSNSLKSRQVKMQFCSWILSIKSMSFCSIFLLKSLFPTGKLNSPFELNRI